MVAVTISLAVSAIAMVVFGAALALLMLEYRGTEFLGWFSYGRRSRPTDPSTSVAEFPGHEPTPSNHRALGAVLAPRGNAARGVELLRVGIGLVWGASLVFLALPSTGYWASLVAAHSVFFAWVIALTTAYLAAAFLLGVTTRLACVVGAALSVAYFATQFGTTFAFLGATGIGPQPLYLAIYAAIWVGGAGRFWSIDGSLWKRGWGDRVPQARWFASLPPAGAA